MSWNAKIWKNFGVATRGSVCRAPLQPLYLRSKMVVNATGAYCDAVLQMDQPSHKTLVQPSSGVHITLPDIYTARNGEWCEPVGQRCGVTPS